jgi:sarcosine oxidase subunit gamma
MADLALRDEPAVSGTAWLRRLPPATRLILQGGAAARAAAAAAFGVPFAETACRACVEGARATLWMGPDEYLLLDTALPSSPPPPVAPAFAAISAALGATPASLVDISHRQVALELSGSQAAQVLNGGCPLDLDLAAFPVGMCTRTLFAKADILLWRTAPDTFHVEVWRSFAEYLTALLVEVSRDIVT